MLWKKLKHFTIHFIFFPRLTSLLMTLVFFIALFFPVCWRTWTKKNMVLSFFPVSLCNIQTYEGWYCYIFHEYSEKVKGRSRIASYGKFDKIVLWGHGRHGSRIVQLPIALMWCWYIYKTQWWTGRKIWSATQAIHAGSTSAQRAN